MYKKRILLIDDEKNFTGLLKLNLENSGPYEVREENRGVNGLTAAREFKPDLILLDIMMPDIGGDEVAAQLKADHRLQAIPIVFLTAVASKEEVENLGGFIGGHSFLAKPASTEEVIECIREHLQRIPESPSLSDLTDQPGLPSQLYQVSKGLKEPQDFFSPKSRPTIMRHFILPVLATFLATGVYFGYKLYSQSQRLLRETFTELQKTQSDLSLSLASASEVLRQQKTIEEQKEKLTTAEDGLDKAKALEAVLHKALQDTQGTKLSYSTNSHTPNLLLSELAVSVVKIHCLANSYSNHIRRGSGILYRAGPNKSALGPYYIQTSLHVVDTTDGSDPQCTIFLYPDHTKGNIYLLFKSQGYRFYRKDIDVALLEPEIVKGDIHAGTFNDLAVNARDEATNPLCDSADIGDHLSILGYPGVGGETLTVTEGIISGFEFDGGTRFIKSSAKLDDGNSGGVAIKDSGCVVGIPTFVRRGQLESMGRILDLNYLYDVVLN